MPLRCCCCLLAVKLQVNCLQLQLCEGPVPLCRGQTERTAVVGCTDHSPIRCAAVTVQLQQTITEAEASDDCKVLELACIVVSRCIQISQDVKEGEPAALASALQKATQEPVACAAVVAMGMAASAVASGWSGVAADCRMGGHTLVAVLLCSLPLVLAEPKTADRAVTCLYGACLAVKAEDEMQIDLALLLQHALGASAQLQEKLLGAFAHVCLKRRR